ncbi:FAD-dependent oxidoreductase [Christensenellaceae bacterium OttesenSCG-928-M15]|nr:FAD-dependent oxidoreductase [Christensenellaceae bacterium OttesenSCG-928-M15]
MGNVKIVSQKNEYSLEKNAVARISSKNCVNCGTCREMCPVGAITENQRVICRVCPECTGKPGLSYSKMVGLATEKACTTGCPLGISPQGYINLTKARKEEAAYKLIWDKNPLPSVCSRICHHPCEEYCKRGILIDSPISIRSLKRYLSDSAPGKPEKYMQAFEERVAIIGAGPAGLSAGHTLAKAGYGVKIFEREAEAGGMLLRGIPEFRLDCAVVAKEVKRLEEAGLEIETGAVLSKAMLAELKKDFDAVLIATGAPKSKELPLEGRLMNGVMTAMEYLQQSNHHQDTMHHMYQCFDPSGEVVVIGGGSVAVDTARAALRRGAKKATVVCLEAGEQIPAHPWELDEAKEEGVQFVEGVSPVRFKGDLRLSLNGIELCEVTSFEKDANGRISFTVDKEKTQFIPAEWAIIAVGQEADATWKALMAECNDEFVFYAGDVSSAKCSVIDAMASGRDTALSIMKKLHGCAQRADNQPHTLHEAPLSEKIYPQTKNRNLKPEAVKLPMEERLNTFQEVEGALSGAQIAQEVARCLECGYMEVEYEKCIGCGVCQKLCPKGDAIVMVPVEGGIK